MTFPDTSLERTGVDPAVSEMIHGASAEPQPPTYRDSKPADEEEPAPIAERVYAPASERVPVMPVPGHRDMVNHTDTSTPERVAVGQSSEPSLAQVPRPDTSPNTSQPPPAHASQPPAYAPYAPPAATRADGQRDEPIQRRPSTSKLLLGLSVSWLTVLSASIGIWLFLRWQRERNRPLNRLRRQARQAAAAIRERVPTSLDEVSDLTSRVRSIR